jgi:hypothetical protein
MKTELLKTCPELLPCPFCGKSAELSMSNNNTGELTHKCRVNRHLQIHMFSTDITSHVEEWNTRTNHETDRLRKALGAAKRIAAGQYHAWSVSGGPNECEHGYHETIPCPACDLATLNEALAAKEGKV